MDFYSPILGRVAPKGREPNLPGDKYNRLTLIAEVPGQTCQASWRRWLCKCDCGSGKERVVQINNLRSGSTNSCGCLQAEGIPRHGMSHTPTYNIWAGVTQRCTNPNHKQWANYGGRGIRMCDRWRNSFEAFLADMGERPEGLTLDRVDNSRDYSPENCAWSTYTQQNRNKRSNRLVSYLGTNICLTEAVERTGLSYRRVWYRLNQPGWSIARALESTDFGDPL